MEDSACTAFKGALLCGPWTDISLFADVVLLLSNSGSTWVRDALLAGL